LDVFLWSLVAALPSREPFAPFFLLLFLVFSKNKNLLYYAFEKRYVTRILFSENTKNKSKKYDHKEANLISALHSERKKGGGAGSGIRVADSDDRRFPTIKQAKM